MITVLMQCKPVNTLSCMPTNKCMLGLIEILNANMLVDPPAVTYTFADLFASERLPPSGEVCEAFQL